MLIFYEFCNFLNAIAFLKILREEERIHKLNHHKVGASRIIVYMRIECPKAITVFISTSALTLRWMHVFKNNYLGGMFYIAKKGNRNYCHLNKERNHKVIHR